MNMRLYFFFFLLSGSCGVARTFTSLVERYKNAFEQNEAINQVDKSKVPKEILERFEDLTKGKKEWDELPGLLQASLIWDVGFVDSSEEGFVKIYTKCGQTMDDIQISADVYSSGCSNNRNTRQCGDFIRQEECSGHDLAPVVECAADTTTLVDQDSSMYVENGPDAQIPYPIITRHSFLDWVMFAIHMQQDIKWGTCPAGDQLSEPVIPCVGFVNVTAKSEWCQPEHSETLRQWINEWMESTDETDNTWKYLVGFLVPMMIVLLVIVFCCCWRRRKRRLEQPHEAYFTQASYNDVELSYPRSLPSYLYADVQHPPNDWKYSSQTAYAGADGSGASVASTHWIDQEQLEIIERLASTEPSSELLVAREIASNSSVILKPVANWDSRTGTYVLQEQVFRVRGLRHPNIARLSVVTWLDQSNLYAVYRTTAEGTLRRILSNPSIHLSWNEEKLQIAQDCCSGLMYLHSFKPPVVHGILNSSNVFVSSDFHAQLAGFGFTVNWNPRPSSAPEVLRGEEYTPKADIFSMGMLLIELDTRLRWEQPGTPQVSLECPSSINDLILRCLDATPDDRPSALELVMELTKIRTDMFEDAESVDIEEEDI